jgi:FAD/FMN-containing dehydrogenase
VIRRGEPGFRAASRLFNPRFDDVRPLAVVEVESADDVAEAIRFARRHGLRCRPKSGGHSYVGASTVDDGLVIDVGRLHRTRYDAASGIATVGAGAGLYSVHRALAGHGRSIPTGTCPTVGATGLTLGGGLGVESRLHGLTSDALTRLTLVTADGRIRRVDRHHNRGLFWASRGGGGGSFGIVTQLRFHTHRVGPTGFFLMSFPWGRAPRVLRGWARRVEAMPRSVWANLHLEALADGSTRVRVVGVCRAGDEDEQAAAMERAIGVDASSVSTFRRSYLEGVQFLGGGTTSPRTGFAAGSDVLGGLPRRVADDLAGLVRARARSGHSAAVILDPLTGAVHDKAPGATAFRWRRQLATVQWYVGLPDDPSRRLLDATYDWIDQAHRVVRRPSVGSYVNYLEPRRRLAAYYGANLDRLRRIKADVDPSGFFRSHYTIR